MKRGRGSPVYGFAVGQRPGSPLAGDAGHRHWQLEGQTHRVGWSSFTMVPALPLLTGA